MDGQSLHLLGYSYIQETLHILEINNSLRNNICMYLLCLLHSLLQDENIFRDEDVILTQTNVLLRQLNPNISVGINKLPVL